MPASVTLNVYDLSKDLAKANGVMKVVGTGVYHCGIEVYGEEWSYGCEEDGSGVFNCDPQGNTGHSFKQAVPMGTTAMSEEMVNKIIRELSDQWQGCEYDLLHHNCCDFSNEFNKRLGLGAIPGWVKSAAGLGARLDDAVHLRGLQKVMDKGKVSRGASASDRYVFGDVSRGTAATLIRGVSNLSKKGQAQRHGSGYQVGDVSSGVLTTVTKGVGYALSEGQKARDATPAEGYRFGDLTRGIVSSLAK